MGALPLLLAFFAAPPVGLEMHHVHFRADDRVALEVEALSGEMHALPPATHPVLGDPHSFEVRLRSAEVALSADSLEGTLEEVVFAAPRARIHPRRVTFDGDRMILSGRLAGPGLPFRIAATVSATGEGLVRIHPVKVSAGGIPVKGLAHLFRIKLGATTLRLGPAVGLTADGDDLILDPSQAVPPPRIVGPVISARIAGDRLHLTFGPAPGISVHPVPPPVTDNPNYIWLHGGVFTVGRLTMRPGKMQILDAHPADPFDYHALRLESEQLPAGHERVLPDGGLVVTLPDYHDLTPGHGSPGESPH